MTLFKILLLSFLSLNIFASTIINETYHIDTNNINSKILFPHAKSNIILFKISDTKNSIRIKNKELSKILKENGFNNFKINSRYIHFKKISPIDTQKIDNFLKKHYLEKYESIDIKNITVTPRSYLEKLPSTFSIHIRDKTHLNKDGVVSIKDDKNRKIFFNYTIDAYLNVFKTRQKVRKGDELSALNTKLHRVKLDRFNSKPLQKVIKSAYQIKRHIKTDKVIFVRDVQPLNLVKRNSIVNVSVYSSGMSISFAAKALKSGKLNDIIRIKKSNSKILKAKVVGHQRVEIR